MVKMDDHECYDQFDGILDGKIDDVLLQVSQVAFTSTFMLVLGLWVDGG